MNLNLSQLRTIYDNWHEPEYATDFADIYWRTLLMATGVIIVGIGCYGASLYLSVSSDSSAASPQAATVAPSAPLVLERSILESTVAAYAARQSSYQSQQSSPEPSVADPSQ